MKRYLKTISVLAVAYILFTEAVWSMHFAPKGSPMLDRFMYDYVIPGIILGIFGFVFVILALIGRYAWDAWRSFCILYISLFLYLIINFSCWWCFKTNQVPKRDFFTLLVSFLTAFFLVLIMIWQLWLKKPKETITTTWTCPNCGKVNTLTLTCYECGTPRVINPDDDSKEKSGK